MDINTVYSSNSEYLKAEDLKKRSVAVVIEAAELKEIGKDRKIVLYFRGKDKSLPLNKTNANAVAYLYGQNTDAWIGRAIELYPTLADYQGRQVEAIRVRPPSAAAARQSAPPPRQETPPPPQDDYPPDREFNDDIPF